MISFAKQLAAAVEQGMADTEKQEKFNATRKKYPKKRKENPDLRRSADRAQADYAKHFATGNTVAKAAGAMGISHVGCLNQVYRYERRNLMYRKSERDTENGGLIFVWGPKPEGEK